MNLTLGINNNFDCAVFAFNGDAVEGAVVPDKDIIYTGKVKKLQKAIKKLRDGKYNLRVVNEEKTRVYGMLFKVKNKTIELAFE